MIAAGRALSNEHSAFSQSIHRKERDEHNGKHWPQI
jgi:hypothetical protein